MVCSESLPDRMVYTDQYAAWSNLVLFLGSPIHEGESEIRVERARNLSACHINGVTCWLRDKKTDSFCELEVFHIDGRFLYIKWIYV